MLFRTTSSKNHDEVITASTPEEPASACLTGPAFKKAERQVDRGGRNPVFVVVHLPGMQGHPEPNPLRIQMHVIVAAQRGD